MKKPMRGAALILALLLTLIPVAAQGSIWDEDPSRIKGVAQPSDITLASSLISQDDENGDVVVKLYLFYKGSNVLDNSALSVLEISPSIKDVESFPFQINWTSYTLGLNSQLGADIFGNPSDTALKYFPFRFKTKEDAINGTYALDFTVRFLDADQNPKVEAPVTTTVTVFATVRHGKDPETPTPSPTATPEIAATPRPQARVILKQYVMEPSDVIGGDSFDLKLVLENTNSSMAVRNMKCSISEAEGTVLPELGSSSFFIESIGPGETHEVTLRMQALPTAGIKPVKMTLKMEYDDKNDKNVEVEDFTLPIHQVVNLRVDNPSYSTDSFVDEPFNLRLQFYNVGKAAMYNTMVTLESDTMVADETLFAGTIEPGGQGNYDVMVTVPSNLLTNGEIGEDMDPNSLLPGVDGGDKEQIDAPVVVDKTGAVFVGYSARAVMASPVYDSSDSGGGGGMDTIICEGVIVVAYEDNYGAQYRKEVPITVNIHSYNQAYTYNPYANLDYDYDSGFYIDRVTGEYIDPATMEVVDRGVNPFLLIGISAGVVVLLVVALLIVLRVRKKRRAKRLLEAEMAQELDSPREEG